MAEGSREDVAVENKASRCPTAMFKDDDPKKGYVTLILTIPQMTVKRSVFRQLQPSNGTVDVKFHTGLVEVQIRLDDEQFLYVYRRSLPDDILALRSKYKVKSQAVVLSLAKTKGEQSWAQHSRHFTQKTNSVSTAAAAMEEGP